MAETLPKRESAGASLRVSGSTGDRRPAEPLSARPRDGHRRDRRPHEPAYLRIADAISEQIGAGLYRAGDQLPTESQLRAQYGVSPMTVRRAIRILLDRGLVTTTQGKGTFVRSPDMGEAIFRLQEMTDLWMDDASVAVLLLEARIRAADEQVAAMLDLSLGDPIVFLRRVIQRKGQPLIYQLEHVVYDEHRPLVEAELQVTSLEGLLHSPQVEGVRGGLLSIQAVSLDAEAAGVLDVPEGSAAFCLEGLFSDFDGRPVSWGRFLCRADQFRLTSYLGATATKAEE
ncbi:MAG: GntR family transcriptional regulator [Actinomycetia bacterium]|nr:GntR family transcriptional regulator [Actinomycetes bacterium]